MEKKANKGKTVIMITAAALAALFLIAAGALAVESVRARSMRGDISPVYADEKYGTPAYAEGVEVITQDVSCGYAVIEMFSKWNCGDITEETLYGEYGKVVTSTGGAFRDEMDKRFPEYSVEMRSYLSDAELIDAIYDSLSDGIPVPVEWAAMLDGEWTLHYSLVTGIDVHNDAITVANPYGYTETLSLAEFLDRTSFEAYEDMPLFLRLGFAFGAFEKNTVFIARPV